MSETSTTNDEHTMAKKHQDESTVLFQSYLDSTFPPDSKCTRSAVIRRQLEDKIVQYLKNPAGASDKNFRHFVKKSGFQLLDLPSVGVTDALVVKVKAEKEVSSLVVESERKRIKRRWGGRNMTVYSHTERQRQDDDEGVSKGSGC